MFRQKFEDATERVPPGYGMDIIANRVTLEA